MKKWVFVLMFLILQVPIANSEEVGHIAALKGRVLIHRNPSVINAALEEKIFLRDTVETKEASRAKILFKDDSLLTLAENSTLKVKEYLHTKKGEKKGRSIFNLVDGEIRAIVGKNKFEVHTPTAVAAARGTFFSVWIEIEQGMPVTGIAVHDGIVDASNINPQITGVVNIEGGKMTKVAKDSPPTPPVPTPPQLLDKLLGCTP